MNNPWKGLPPREPYVLKEDWDAVERLNDKLRRRGAKSSTIRHEILPVPYVGNPLTASVILLSLNPGFQKPDLFHYKSDKFRKACKDSMLHRPSKYPFYLLDPRFSKTCGGEYWSRRLRTLTEKHGNEAVARAVCVIQWHPYHSAVSTGHPDQKFCASQDYSGWLVEQAIKRNCVVLLLRSREEWQSLVPELKSLPGKGSKGRKPAPIVNAPRSQYVTEKNLEQYPGLWLKINDAIAKHKR
jgi:hypothetical protein